MVVWRNAFDLATTAYRLTGTFPSSERFGLTSQLRRAAVSVVSNIAEGNGRSHRAEYLHHLSIAYGSLLELETQILLARALDYVQAAETNQALASTAVLGRQLIRLRRALTQVSTCPISETA